MATEEKTPTQFPVGLRVLAIDNDSTVLENIKQMCNGYRYQAITYSNALRALDRVRENRDCVDVILIDVNMPNMDGHEFLQRIRKEIDVPVIVMSLDDSTSTKMQSIKLGACDYWKKPLHKDQIRNMWMHVARKAWNENKVEIKSGSLEDDDKKKRGNDDSIIEATGGVVRDQKRSNSEESDVEEPQAKKAKGRVIWAADDLEIKFLKAVIQLGGIDNAVPKRILELMNVPGLTRDNVASHLQKVRHQAQKNKSGKVKLQQQNGKSLANTVQATTIESSVSASGKIERQAFAVTGRVPCKTLTGDLMPKEEQWPTKQGMTYGHSPLSIFPPNISKPKEEQWPNHPHVEQGMTYGHPALSICPPPPIIPNPQSMMNVDEESGYGVWSPSAIPNTMRLSIQERMDTLQVQEQEQQQQQQMQMNFQPSCLVVSGNSSSVTSGIFHEYTTTAAAASSIPVQVQGGSFPAANTLVPPYSSRSGDSFIEESLVNLRYDDK